MKLLNQCMVKETLFGAMSVLLLMVACSAQQETDPSWYDPWANPNPAAARTAQGYAAHAPNPQVVRAKAMDAPKKPVDKRAPRRVATVKPVANEQSVKIALARP
jgi:hypothetical protein